MVQTFRSASLKTRLLVICGLLVSVPLAFTVALTSWQGAESIESQAEAGMSLAVAKIRQACEIQDELVREKLRSDANQFRELFERSGGGIPEMGKDDAIVDRVRNITGSSATIFRMEEGRMVRVSTNVRKDDGTRAVGTSIESDSPVYQAIREGREFQGRAKVMGAWNQAHYSPIVRGGKVAGALFVGVRLQDYAKLKEAIASTTFGRTGFIYALDSAGKIAVHPKLPVGTDMNPFPFTKEILARKDGTLRYEFEGKRVASAFTSYDTWDWILVARQDESDFLAPVRALAGYTAATAGIALAVGLGVLWLFATRLTRTIGGSAETIEQGVASLTEASSHFAGVSQALADGSSAQAASIEETSAAMEQMSAMTQRNAENAGAAKGIAVRAHECASDANAAMERLVARMAEISGTGEEIRKIIKTIDEIAFQTNLLALNAAVEAARAGEAGAGFAVVADEVRNLAQRAAAAAKNTAELIEGAIRQIGDGTGLVEQTNDRFMEVASSVSKMNELVVEIAEASSEQARGIGEIVSAISQMDKVTQRNAASSEEVASSSEEIHDQAERLHDAVMRLEEAVRGGGAPPRVTSVEFAPARELPRRIPVGGLAEPWKA